MWKLSIQEEKACNRQIIKKTICNEDPNVNMENKEIVENKWDGIEVHIANMCEQRLQNQRFCCLSQF